MRRKAVQSSNLRSVGYLARTQLLEVLFRSGRTYQYTGVPAATHQRLMQAGSHGKYFHRNVRTSYPYKKV